MQETFFPLSRTVYVEESCKSITKSIVDHKVKKMGVEIQRDLRRPKIFEKVFGTSLMRAEQNFFLIIKTPELAQYSVKMAHGMAELPMY